MDIYVGEKGWLRAKTLGCAQKCWQQPAVTVLSVNHAEVTVRLPDGREISTARDNFTHTRPRAPRRIRAKANPKPATQGAEEVPLW